MTSRSEFAKRLSLEKLSVLERAIAFLWFYRQNQEYDERTASELAEDMSEEGFALANITRLRKALLKTRYIVKGHRVDSFRLNLRYYSELSQTYSRFISEIIPTVQSCIIPFEWVAGTRLYYEKLVHQINGCYQFGFYDGCIVLTRRLMESLIIDTYISNSGATAIKDSLGNFLPLDNLIKHIIGDSTIHLTRNFSDTMKKIKEMGDTAAHNRVYITYQIDIDDNKTKIRKLIRELLSISDINP